MKIHHRTGGRRAGAALVLLLSSGWVQADRLPSVEFLDGNAARSAIVNDARDPYFEKLQTLEMAAKTGEALSGPLDAQRVEVRKRYQQAIRPFRPEEQEAIRGYIAALQPLIHDYPRYARQPWRFVKVADHIEGGLPHTRDDFIVLSEFAAKSLFDLKRRYPAEQALLRAGSLLVHEQAHVLQRLEPKRFERLYASTFGYRRVAPIPLPNDLSSSQVANPDGMSCCWLFPCGRGLIWPFLVFAGRDGLRRMPDDFRMLAVSVSPLAGGTEYRVERDADGRSRVEELMRVREYVEAFPLTQNFYHPNETAADLFARLVLFDGLTRERMPETRRRQLEPEYARLRPAFRAVFTP